MDHIEKALKRAREQKASEPAAPSQTRTTRKPPQAKPEAKSAQADIGSGTTRVDPVGKRTLSEQRVIAGQVRDVCADTYRMLRAQVIFRLQEIGGNTVGICSASPGEGKTLTAVNLAVSLALDPNYTVLLVDLDLRRPKLASYFGLATEKGLSDYLIGDATLTDCLVNPGLERLVIMPGGKPLYSSSEALASQKMRSLANEFKHRYADRIVIYDLPPLLASDDSLVFLPQLDATLLVVQDGKAKAGDIQRAMELLDGCNLLGTVLNKSSEGDQHPYY
jgi:capsular exopolysaccharide synthesis family protein